MDTKKGSWNSAIFTLCHRQFILLMPKFESKSHLAWPNINLKLQSWCLFLSSCSF